VLRAVMLSAHRYRSANKGIAPVNGAIQDERLCCLIAARLAAPLCDDVGFR